jgi:hypothetical protein
LVNRITSAEECDASGADSGIGVGNKRNITNVVKAVVAIS